MDIDMECSSVNMGRNKKRGFHPKLDSSCNLGRSSTMKSLNMEHFMFSDESKFILS